MRYLTTDIYFILKVFYFSSVKILYAGNLALK